MLLWNWDVISPLEEHTVIYILWYNYTLNSSLLTQQTVLMQETSPYHTSLSFCLTDLVSESPFVIYAVTIFILFKSFMIAWVNLPLFQLAITIPTIHWQLWYERVSSLMSRIPHRTVESDIYHLSHGLFHLCACRCVVCEMNGCLRSNETRVCRLFWFLYARK